MSMTYLFALTVSHPTNQQAPRMNFPNIGLHTLLFDSEAPYLYLIDEN